MLYLCLLVVEARFLALLSLVLGGPANAVHGTHLHLCSWSGTIGPPLFWVRDEILQKSRNAVPGLSEVHSWWIPSLECEYFTYSVHSLQVMSKTIIFSLAAVLQHIYSVRSQAPLRVCIHTQQMLLDSADQLIFWRIERCHRSVPRPQKHCHETVFRFWCRSSILLWCIFLSHLFRDTQTSPTSRELIPVLRLWHKEKYYASIKPANCSRFTIHSWCGELSNLRRWSCQLSFASVCPSVCQNVSRSGVELMCGVKWSGGN